jgi:hypothetical protein
MHRNARASSITEKRGDAPHRAVLVLLVAALNTCPTMGRVFLARRRVCFQKFLDRLNRADLLGTGDPLVYGVVLKYSRELDEAVRYYRGNGNRAPGRTRAFPCFGIPYVAAHPKSFSCR